MNSYGELISHIKNADWSSANQKFADIMQTKVADALVGLRANIFKEGSDQKKS